MIKDNFFCDIQSQFANPVGVRPIVAGVTFHGLFYKAFGVFYYLPPAHDHNHTPPEAGKQEIAPSAKAQKNFTRSPESSRL